MGSHRRAVIVPLTADEYDGYAPPLLGRLRDGVNRGGVEAYLAEAEVFMDMPTSPRHRTEVAAAILSWFDSYSERDDPDGGGGQ